MAGPTVKEVLVKWGIDTSSWKTAVQQISKMLDDQNKKSKQASKDAIEAFDEQISSAKDLLAVNQKLTAEIKKQDTALAKIGAQYDDLVDKAFDQISAEKAITAELQKQMGLRKSVTTESSKTYQVSGAGKHKQVTASFGQQQVFVSSMKATMQDLEHEVDKLLSLEKLVTKEMQKQHSSLQSQKQTIKKPGLAIVKTPSKAILPASDSSKKIAELNLLRATGLKSEEKIREKHQEIVLVLDQEIAKLKQAGIHTAQQVSQLEKLSRLRGAHAAAGRGESTGLGKTLEEFGTGAISRMMGTLGFAVFSAEGFGRVIESLTEKMKEFVKEIGPLQQLREQFEKLASSQGIAPAKFIDDMRVATKGLVSDTEMYRNANTFLQSGLQVSQEDILKLTQATVGLARAQGKDATQALQALNQFFLTGYARTLSHVTGLQASQIGSMRSMGRQMGGTAANAMEFKQALEAITKQYEAIGEPAQTYTEALAKLRNQQNRVLEEFIQGVERSAGFRGIIGNINELADKIGALAEKAAAFGEKVGNVAAQIYQAVSTILSGLAGVAGDIFSLLLTDVKNLASVFGLSSTETDDFVSRLTTLEGVAATVSETITILVGGVRELVTWLRFAAEAAPNLERGFVELIPGLGRITSFFDKLTSKDGLSSLDKLKSALNAAKSREAQIAEDVGAGLGKAEQIRAGKKPDDYGLKFGVPNVNIPLQQELESEKRLAKIKEEIAIQTAKIQLEQAEGRIKREQALNQLLYDEELKSFDDYISARKRLEDEDFAARKKQIDDEFKAKQQFFAKDTELERAQAALQRAQVEKGYAADKKALQDQQGAERDRIREDLKSGKLKASPTEIQGMSEKIASQAKAQQQLLDNNYRAGIKVAQAMEAEIAAKSTLNSQEKNSKEEALAVEHQGKMIKIDQEVVDKAKAAREKLVSEEGKLDQAQLERRKQILEEEFKEQEVTANQYLSGRIAIINAEFAATQANAEKKLTTAKNSLEAQATFSAQMADAAEKREKDLTALSLQEWEIRSKAAEDAFDRVKKMYESQVSYQQSLQKLNPLSSRSGEVSALESLIGLESIRLRDEEKQLETMTEINADWFTQYQRVQQTREEIVKYNQQLIQAKDHVGQLAQGVGELGKAFGSFTGNRFRAMAAGLEQAAKTLEAVSKRNQERAQLQEQKKLKAAGLPSTPEGKVLFALKQATDGAGQQLKTVGTAADSAANELSKWKANLSESEGSFTKFIKTAEEALLRLAGAADKAADKQTGTVSKDVPASGGPGPSLPGEMETASDKFTTKMTSLSDMPLPLGQISPLMQQFAAALTQVTAATDKAGDGFGKLSSFFSQGGAGAWLGDSGLGGFFKNFGKDMGKAQDSLGEFGKGLSSAIQGVGGFVSAAKGEGGPLQAGLSGAASGFQLGSMIPLPGAPIIGAGVGLVTGVFAGKARKQAEKLSKDIVAQFNAALQNLNSGTQSLSATIQLEIQNIQEAVTRLSGKKGGRDQLKNILPNMEQQLAQLQQQQKQIIQTFDDQLNSLNAPQAYQDQLNSIDQIIQKYQQYIQAGGNVANANEYLRQSYANLVQNGLNTLNQDEQDAINNALNYNDLLVQRQQLIQDTNVQMQEIMSQGVAVRQLPEGVSRAIQLQKLAYESGKQLDSMNAEISVAQHKMNIEQQIFGLATTRVGLESQLVVLQNAQTDQDMKRIAALGQVVGALQTALPTSNQAALQELGLGGAFVSPLTERGLIPTPPVKTGIADVDLQNQLQYQQALAAYQLQANYPIGYISPTGPIPTTSPIPSTIGTPTNTLGGGAVYLSGTGMYGTAAGTGASALALAQQSAAAAAALNQQFNATLGVGGTLPSALPGTAAPLVPGSLPSLTTNNQQIDTIATNSGEALLVSLPPEQLTTLVTGPGTTQRVGIVGTAQQVAAGAQNSFNALTGAMNKATTIFTGASPAPATPAPTSPLLPAKEATTTVPQQQTIAPPTPPTILQPVQSPTGGKVTTAGTIAATAALGPLGLLLRSGPSSSAKSAADSFANSANQIVDSFNQGAITSSAALAGLKDVEGQASTRLAGDKANRKTLLEPLNAQIDKLIAQLQQIPAAAQPVAAVAPQPTAPQPRVPTAAPKPGVFVPPLPMPVAPPKSTALVASAIQQNASAVNAQVSAAVQRHTVESGITQMSHLRVVNEAALTKMKMTEIRADMQRIAAHTQLLQMSKGYGASANTLEDLMQNIYQTRSRQGFAGFYGETSNPT